MLIDFCDLLEPVYRNAPSKNDIELPKFKYPSSVAVPVLEIVVDRSYMTNICYNAIADFFDWSCYSEVIRVTELTVSSSSLSAGAFFVLRLIGLHLIAILILATLTCIHRLLSAILVILSIWGAEIILGALSSVSCSGLVLLLWRCTSACFTWSVASSSL